MRDSRTAFRNGLARVLLLIALPVTVVWGGTQPVSLQSSDSRLSAAFDWAERQALAYVFHGDPVGDWYDAALPGRQAFCMRDTAHQYLGAHFLGLDGATHNMFRKFAENISEAKDWCSYWEIDRYNRPAPVDFENNNRFWYTLPANFDVLDAAYRMYVWSGDSRYLSDPVFREFYRRTVRDYTQRWDLSPERILQRPRLMNVRGPVDPKDRFQANRGIPSYDEAGSRFTVGIDQLAVEYAGFSAYARIAELQGDAAGAKEFLAQAKAMQALVNRAWWDSKTHRFYSQMNGEHQLEGHGMNTSLLYYGVAETGEKSDAVLRSITEAMKQKQPAVELESHLPEVLYRYGRPREAYRELLDLTSEGKSRREYPEVSFSVIGAIVHGLMGVNVEDIAPGHALPDGRYVTNSVSTVARLTAETAWVEASHVRVGSNEIRLRHDGVMRSTLENTFGPSLVWRACFAGATTDLFVDGKRVEAEKVTPSGQPMSCVPVTVAPGRTRSVAKR